MWGLGFWAKNFFGGLFWGPSSSSPPPVVVDTTEGGSYGPLKKKKKKKGEYAPSYVAEGPRPADTIREMFFREQDMADEEELILMLGWLE